MNLPESLEQYLIQFLDNNKNKSYPDNYNEIVDASQVIQDYYFLQQSDLDDKDSYIEELEGDMSCMQSNADNVISDIRCDINELENELEDSFEDGIPTSIYNIIKNMKTHCDNWCY